MTNDIDFIKACAEIADGWSWQAYGLQTPNGRLSLPEKDLDSGLFQTIVFPLLISQTADKLEITINPNYGKKTWQWFKIDERIELIEDGKSYETADEARIAGIKKMLRRKNE